MAEHRIDERRHWLAWLAAGAVVVGLAGIVINPLFRDGGRGDGEPLAAPAWPKLAGPSSAAPVRPSVPPPSDPPSVPPSDPPPVQTGNLLASAGADDVPGGSGDPTAAIAGWTILEGGPSVIRYGVEGYPGGGSPGPADRGTNLFGGGVVGRSRLGQTVTLPGPAAIDAGTALFGLTGFLGGFADQDDAATCTVTFVDGDGHVLAGVTLGPVTAADRGQVTALLRRSAAGAVPAGARTAQVELIFTRAAGEANDGYADALSFEVTSDAK